ncbi:hypothetical protein PR202_gb21427 [Eleusine coracana subsp. coracana]|uniref:Uncharacterized protein n=1 Tax=Eleusine coracana subsp. coracana TaxID=191504 RepID=A0AAV5FE39_ELECO|nr:hypothetical protein PR202_gb21427 [Eleusine coracana subsp. coracana]
MERVGRTDMPGGVPRHGQQVVPLPSVPSHAQVVLLIFVASAAARRIPGAGVLDSRHHQRGWVVGVSFPDHHLGTRKPSDSYPAVGIKQRRPPIQRTNRAASITCRRCPAALLHRYYKLSPSSRA